MPRAKCGEIELEYLDEGQGPPLLMIMGIRAQLVHWPDDLVRALVDRGLRVIRFDNRDIGRSTWLSGPERNGGVELARALLGLPVRAPYTLSDMAGDAAALLDHLGIERAHVVGASMGGMIAQHLAFERPERVASLVSIMSTTGARTVSRPEPRALRALFARTPRDAEEAGLVFERVMRTISGTGFPLESEELRALGRLAYERGSNPAGFHRQMAAIAKSGDRTRRLQGVRAPTLVLHGDQDPLVPLVAGRATAAAIPGARLRVIEGMGHSLPRGAWPAIVDEIVTLVGGV